MKIVKLLIFLLLFLVIIIFLKLRKKEVVYVVSDIDHNKYLVRDLKDKQKAANLLAKIKKNILLLTKHLNKYKNTRYLDYKKYIQQLTEKIKFVVISESSEDNMYTSYSVNKGEQLVFCLRSKRYKNRLHNINLLMYVTLHETAHVACPEYGHTELFKKIFAFLTRIAIELNIYEKIYFNEEPSEYCGLMISDSII